MGIAAWFDGWVRSKPWLFGGAQIYTMFLGKAKLRWLTRVIKSVKKVAIYTKRKIFYVRNSWHAFVCYA